ncbi:B12-binding domain-containing radical SAM protein [Pseudobacteroides cellulosolvens]|uniref:Radical SAM domain protein n=1 Tax=Pseudobacteroides cellulosolvens ATCC 35603 = DSM 2933 TaxID=398512 RepID=A0A0L6JU28_9FIRM|nr:radical SAM protein [Pseudobacteroides cellulosolvens]KNY28932.1 Radical SAM domain protein [Pseudobacteroides cellulosolvens ATCC 35603 = DSM 2933]
MMKILFINSIHDGKVTNQIGTLSLATILNSNGHNAEIADFNYLFKMGIVKKKHNKQEDIHSMGSYILSKAPDIVGFSCMCNSYHIFIELSKYIREKSPNIKILFGGPQATLTAEETLKAFDWIDLIAMGESEKSIVDIMNVFENNSGFEDLTGVAYRQDNEIIIKKSTLIENLDYVPKLDYSLLPYFDKISLVEIDVGRGCPFECSYCSTKTFWKRKFRIKAVDQIIEEIKELYYKHNKTKFNFVHDLFTVNKNIVLDFCNKVIGQRLKIRWGCSARIDTLDEELVKKMVEAGCIEIYIGIETGSPRMQKIVHKNLNLNHLDEKLKLFKKYNLEITFSFIYGFPEENDEDLRQTMEVIQKIYSYGFKKVQLHQCSILAGTEMYNNYKEDLVYQQIIPDTVDNNNIDEYKDIILRYPTVFPHFYNLSEEIAPNIYRYQYLDEFVCHKMKFFNLSMPQTYRLLRTYFNNELIKIYNDIKETCKDILVPINDEVQAKELEHGKQLAEYINKKDFGIYKDIIRQMFKYELDYLEFKNNSVCDEEKLAQYDFNVLKIETRNLGFKEIDIGKTAVRFKNNNAKEIIVEKIVV